MFVGLGAVIVAMMPRAYEATATLMVDYDVTDPLNGEEFPIGLLSGYMATQTELLRNPTVLLTVVDRLNLTEDEDYTAGYRGDADGLREHARSVLNENLAVYQGQFGSQLIYVSYSASSPKGAALVANTVAEVFKEQDFLRTTDPTTERAVRYTEQLDQLRAKADQVQQEYTAFHQRNALIDAGENGANVELALLSDLEQQLLEAQRDRRSAQAMTRSETAVGNQVMNSQLIQTMKSQLALQESRLAEARTTLGPRHPQVIELTSQISTSRQALANEVNSYTRNAQTGLGSAQQLEESLQAAVAAQRANVLSSSALYDQAAKYRLELNTAQAVYRRALDGYDEVMFASMGNYTNVSSVSLATPPTKASKPRVAVYLLLAAMAGGFFGLAIPLGYELINRRVRCRDDFERDSGVPVLAEFGAMSLHRGVA
jgi:uncharacterized protein involved in exopolysaccharide biosynthesis